MIKTELISQITEKTGIEKVAVSIIIEKFMTTVKQSMCNGENVYLRGFGSFNLVKRAEKNFHYAPGKYKIIPEHYEPLFKLAQEFKFMLK